jgi:RNA polymerase sigma factor (sigma-70 family)
LAVVEVCVEFRARADHELASFSDEELVRYVRQARAAGDQEAARRGIAVLVYGFLPLVRSRVAVKVPSALVDDVAHDVMLRCLGSAFDRDSLGEFRSWLDTILQRTVADFYRAQERTLDLGPLPDEDSAAGGVGLGVEDDSAAVMLRWIVERVMGRLSAEHQIVIRLHVFAGLSAPEVCDRVPGMAAGNVNQIASRFRQRVRSDLESGRDLS